MGSGKVYLGTRIREELTVETEGINGIYATYYRINGKRIRKKLSLLSTIRLPHLAL